MAYMVREARAAANVGPAAWQTPEGALQVNSSQYAWLDYGTDFGDEFELSGFEFDDLPSSITVDGIGVFIKVEKDTSTGPGTGTISFIVNLSWDNGSSYSGSPATVTALDPENTEKLYMVGGPSNTWGRSWTRAELQNGAFKIKVTSDGTVDSGNPRGHVLYVAAVAHYTSTVALSLTVGEGVGLTETISPDRLALDVSERLGLGYDSVTFGGDIITGIEGGALSDFQNALDQRVREESFHLQLALAGTGYNLGEIPLIGLGTSTPQTSSGILEFGDINYEGSVGQPSPIPECVFRLRNEQLADFAGANDFIEQWQGERLVGAWVLLWSWIKDAGTWRGAVIFRGVVEEATAKEEYVELRALASERHATVPALEINSETFDYGSDEGQLLEEWAGTPIPIGYGRFDATAVGTWASGHPFFKASTESADSAGAAFLPPYLGVKIPMMPVVMASDQYLRPTGNTSIRTTYPTVAVFLQGDRKNTPLIQVATHHTSALLNTLFPRGGNVHSGAATEGETSEQYQTIFTWVPELNRAAAFRTDMSLGVSHFYRGGAGDLRLLVPGGVYTAKDARHAYPVYVNRTGPKGVTGVDPNFTGAIQSVAISPTQLSQTAHRTGAANWNNTHYTYGTTGVTNPENILDTDYSSAVSIAYARLSTQIPIAGNVSLGPIHSISFAWITDTTGTSVKAYAHARFSPWDGIHLFTGWGNVTQENDAVWFNSTAYNFFSAVQSRRKMGFVQRPPSEFYRYQGDVEPPSREGWAAQWDFTHYGLGLDGNLQDFYVNLPGDLAFYEFNTPTKTLKLVAAWLDVVYKPSISAIVDRRSLVNNGEDMYGINFGEGQSPWIPVVRWSGLDNPYVNASPKPQAQANLYVTGQGSLDIGGAPYTGGASGDLIENPADIAGHLIHHYLSKTGDFEGRAVSTDFGSFVTARTLLNSAVTGEDWAMTLVVTEKQDIQQVLDNIGRQSRCFFQRQISFTDSAPVWRCFVDLPDPEVSDTARLYHTTGGIFGWDDLVANSLTARLTPLSEVGNNIILRHGLHLPTGRYAYSQWVNRSGTSFATDASTYTGACGTSASAYGVERQMVFEAPDIWRPEVAEALCKYYLNTRRERRVIVEFDIFARVDIQPGHVIYLADEISDRIPWPGNQNAGGTDWTDHPLNVVSVTISKGVDEPILVHVVAVECFTEPS